MSCWQCDQCLAGRPHTCRKLRFLGCPKQAEGCLSEYIVMPETSCFPIPDSMTLEEAAVSEPLAIGVYGVRMSIPMSGAKVGILGVGPIGLSVLLPAKSQGAEQIYVIDKIDDRLELARRAGAAWSGNPDKEDIVAAVRSGRAGPTRCSLRMLWATERIGPSHRAVEARRKTGTDRHPCHTRKSIFSHRRSAPQRDMHPERSSAESLRPACSGHDRPQGFRCQYNHHSPL